MRAPDLSKLLNEPVRAGVITGFASLSAAAAVQLAVGTVLELSGTTSTVAIATATMTAIVAGGTSAVMAMRTKRRSDADLRVAEALAHGDFSQSLPAAEDTPGAMGTALVRIAERELDNETSRARLAKDTSLQLNQMEDALDAVPFEISVYNHDGLLVRANRAFLKQCNEIGAVVALGMTWLDVMSAIAKAPGAGLPLNERQTWINQQEALRQESLSTFSPVRFNRYGGCVADLLISASPEGNRTEIIRDVTDLVELEERVQRTTREAAAAESIKQVTLSRLSHTIRTPMTGVLAATELLGETNLDARQRERLDIIRRSASTLLGVVQDMFDMAAGAAANEDPMAVLQPQPVTRSALVLELPGQPMDAIATDLVGNGYEIGRAESVELMSQAIKILAGQGRYPDRVHVPDNAARDRLIEQLGDVDPGKIRIEVANAGVAAELPAASGLPDGGKPLPLDVVIAESDEVGRISYANALSSSGLSFRIAGTGEEAISHCKRQTPRLILLDITLPDKDGLATGALIRKNTRLANTPIVAMARHFVQGDKAKCLSNGMDGYVIKPSIGSEMVELVTNWLQQAEVRKAG